MDGKSLRGAAEDASRLRTGNAPRGPAANKHFASKDELLGLATAVAFDELLEPLTRISEDFHDRTQARSELFRTYLSTEHSRYSGRRMRAAALASDAAHVHGDSPLQRSCLEGLEKVLDVIAEYEEVAGGEQEEARRLAVIDLATLVGHSLWRARSARLHCPMSLSR
nr:hypothetical protein OG999_31370 [Streptomyces sp. NBC_00886]